MKSYSRNSFAGVIFLLALISSPLSAQGVLTFEDVMKFEDIGSIVFSSNGKWMAYEVAPDRGDGKVEVMSSNASDSYSIPLAENPAITEDGSWVGAIRTIPLAVQLDESVEEKPVQGFKLLGTADGAVTEWDSVRSFEFSRNGKWLALRRYTNKAVSDHQKKNKKVGSPVLLRNLETGADYSLPFVSEMKFDSLSNYLAYTVVDTSGEANGLFVFNLEEETSNELLSQEQSYFANLSWDEEPQRLAFTKAILDSNFTDGEASLHLWNASDDQTETLLEAGSGSEGYVLRSNNNLLFTNDGKRLFFGLMDEEMAEITGREKEKEEEKDKGELDIYDIPEIKEERDLDIWHGDDPQIKPHEKNTWNNRKNHLYTAVYHLDTGKWVQLADKDMPEIRRAHNSRRVLGSSRVHYMKEMTWEGFFDDYYVVDLNDGSREKFASKITDQVSLSPDGRFVAYYEYKHWFLLNIEEGQTQKLTLAADVPFYDEDHDYPSRVPSYGSPGWVEGSEAVLIYDKYDIWKFNTAGGKATNITDGEGRANKRIFRVQRLDTDWNEFFGSDQELFLESYHDLHKNFGFYSANISRKGVKRLLEEDKKFTFLSKPDDTDRIFYKREAYDEFPNIWTAENRNFKKKKKLTHMHENLHKKWNWGKAELIDWLSLDGTFIQGVVIKPDNYDPDKRYPVMTYYYRFFTDRLHDFNEPKTNHRPVFAQYVSDDYIVFLPDIRFEVGTPGFASTKSLVPGIQKLVEMGLADEDKLGLHGHSWSGYQTAFMVTQTDIFDAAVAGAPVSNMTSAYSGIRWGSGLARQFQYERTQSRIGQSLVDAPEKYIENSPVFFADRINTPLLIQHGDEDGAVPWYQSIEMYLAMRRFDKNIIFLHYHGEPHHLQKFPNKLDYAIRMKEYFDYYLKGEGSPQWIIKGEAYEGN